MKRRGVSTSVTIGAVVVAFVIGLGVMYIAAPSFIKTSSSSTSTSKSPLVLGFIGRLSVPYWIVQEAGFKAAATHYGFVPELYEPPQLETQDQITTLNTYAAEGFAGIVISPNDPVAPVSAINTVINQGIPVITSGTDSPNSSRLIFIGYSPEQLGAYAANEVIYAVKQNNGGSLPTGWAVTWSEGSLASTEDVASLNTFNQTITAAGGRVLPPLLDQGSAATAESNAATAIARYGSSLYAMYGFYDYTGPAISQAVNSTSSPHRIAVIGTGLISGDLPYMTEGVMTGVIDLNEYQQGYLSGELLYQLATSGGKSNWNSVLSTFLSGYPTNTNYLVNLQFIAGANLTTYQNTYPVVWSIITGS